MRGIAAVQHGKAISLEHPVETRPGHGKPDHKKVELDVKIGGGGRTVAGLDVVTIDAHGTGNTHMDSISHMGLDGKWHGGIPAESSYTDDDMLVAWAQHGVVTRGVLVDIPAVRGVPWVVREEPVRGEEIDAALAATGVTFEPGDALLIYMGRDRYEAAGNVYPTGLEAQKGRPGIGPSGSEWIADHDVSVACWDFHDAKAEAGKALEVHMLIWAVGQCLVDNSSLGPLAEILRNENRATGLLTVPPPAIYRSTGVLVNPTFVY
ncbi:MAG: cyclase family protein [Microbacterium sp.]